MTYAARIPGLRADGSWDLPERLNMAAQVLAGAGPGEDDGAEGRAPVAIIDRTGARPVEVTRHQLREMSQGLARALLAGGVGRGDRVGVLLGQDPWCAAAHLAAWTIGAISVPLFKLFKRDALDSRVRDAGVTLVLTDAEGAALLDGLAPAVIAAEFATGFVSEPGQAVEQVPFAMTGPDDPAVLIYTSGTTGAPKGALHGHRVLTGHLPGVALSHDHLGQPGDVIWTPADWAWIGGLFDVLMPGLALGVPVVAARAAKFDADAAAALIAQAGIRNVFFPPTALRMLRAADAAIPGLRSVASGGEPLGAEMLAWGRRAFGLEINEFYGQTECNMIVSSCGADVPARPGCIGRPVPGHAVEVITETGTVAQGEGDIAVRRGSASMFLGYWNRAQATAEKFRGDWMLTGDRGCREAGHIRFVGREDDVITSAGYRIGPAEVEDCLLTHPAVATAGVVGKPDAMRTEIVKAYVVLKPDEDVAPGTLQRWVKERLASYSYPREIEILDSLPMTVTGKVIRKELKARARAELENAT